MSKKTVDKLLQLKVDMVMIGDGSKRCPGASSSLDTKAWMFYCKGNKMEQEALSNEMTQDERALVDSLFVQWFRNYLAK